MSNGLGIWNLDRDEKISISLRSIDYKGGFLPKTNISTNTLTWANEAEVVVINPSPDDTWHGSRRLALSTGSSYEALKDVLQELDYSGQLKWFQPISLDYSPDNKFTSDEQVLLWPEITTNSYSFVAYLLNSLNEGGVDLETFAEVYQSRFSYATDLDYDIYDPKNTVAWSDPAMPNSDVVRWFNDLDNCMTNAVTEYCGYGSLIFNATKKCYSHDDYAYIYRNYTSVYKVPLKYGGESAKLLRLGVTLPENHSNDEEHFSTSDWAVFGFILLIVLIGVIKIIMLIRKNRGPALPLPRDEFKEQSHNLLETEGRSSILFEHAEGTIAQISQRVDI